MGKQALSSAWRDEAQTLKAGASSLWCNPPLPPLQPDLPTHLQVVGWGQQDPGHVQSHVPLPQNHGGVTAQVWGQLRGRGRDEAHPAWASVRLTSASCPIPSHSLRLLRAQSFSPGPAPTTHHPLFPEASLLGQPDASRLISPATSQACGCPFPQLWEPRAGSGVGRKRPGEGSQNSPPGSQEAHCTSPQRPGPRTHQAAPHQGYPGPDGPLPHSSEDRPRGLSGS